MYPEKFCNWINEINLPRNMSYNYNPYEGQAWLSSGHVRLQHWVRHKLSYTQRKEKKNDMGKR